MTGPCARCRRSRDLLARGLCSNCYSTCRKNGTVSNWPRSNRRLTDVVEEYRFFTDTGMSRTDCALSLGMSLQALDRALYRARATGLVAS